MRREPDFFEDAELDLLYIAKRLKESLNLEELLTASSIEFLVEPDQYVGGLIFRRERTGAFFYVDPGCTETAREILARNGYRL